MDHQAAEETEHIPWALLADDMGDDRRRRNALIATVAVGLLAALVAFLWFRRPPGVMVEVPPAAVAALPASAPDAFDTTLPIPTMTPAETIAPNVLYAEADLMAVMPEHEVRLVAARAEVAVADHFTVDGYSDEESPSGAYSWVEWARTTAVTPDASGYQVTVHFRTISRPDPEAPLQRGAVRAVAVPVAVASDGSLTVTDLPSPVEATPSLEDLPSAGDDEIPAEVAAGAADHLAQLGYPHAEIVGGTQEEQGWRLVVEAGDGAGPARPVVVRIDDG